MPVFPMTTIILFGKFGGQIITIEGGHDWLYDPEQISFAIF